MIIFDDEGNEIDDLPKKWEICSVCNGHGKHSHRLGAITQDEWSEWDEDDQRTYLRGGYDESCSTCGGTGKVEVIDYDNLTPEMKELVDAAVEEERQYQSMIEMERRMGA